MARLVIKSNGLSNQVIELKLGVNRIGRSPDNDFQIEHPTISAVHCELELAGGELVVRDCDSTNGTFVRGEPIHEAKLLVGQTFCMGDVELFVETTDVTIAIPKVEAEAPAAPPVVLSDGTLMCSRHPQSRVTHRCTHCGEVMCGVCLHTMRRSGGKALALCPDCSHPCELIGAPKKKKKTLFGFLHKTVKLPFVHGPKRGK
jgi:pSer/pThr/pTyr-binding forkhead associated (FHA) protein